MCLTQQLCTWDSLRIVWPVKDGICVCGYLFSLDAPSSCLSIPLLGGHSLSSCVMSNVCLESVLIDGDSLQVHFMEASHTCFQHYTYYISHHLPLVVNHDTALTIPFYWKYSVFQLQRRKSIILGENYAFQHYHSSQRQQLFWCKTIYSMDCMQQGF